MKTADFDYHLPPELIAQTPIEPRDAARLLQLDRSTGEVAHAHFYDLPQLLQPGDVLDLIALRFNKQLSCLGEQNGLSAPYSLKPGQVLLVNVNCLPYDGFSTNFTQLATLVPGVIRGVPDGDASGAKGNAETPAQVALGK